MPSSWLLQTLISSSLSSEEPRANILLGIANEQLEMLIFTT
jgi:hypothetical protein